MRMYKITYNGKQFTADADLAKDFLKIAFEEGLPNGAVVIEEINAE